MIGKYAAAADRGRPPRHCRQFPNAMDPALVRERRGLTPEGLVTRQLVEVLLGSDKFAKQKRR
jgi:hypothetical protein